MKHNVVFLAWVGAVSLNALWILWLIGLVAYTRYQKLKKALTEVLGLFPNSTLIWLLSADDGHPRPCHMDGCPTDKQVQEWRRLIQS